MAMDSKPMFSFQARLFLLIVLFTWVLTAAFFTMQYAREREFKVQMLDTRLQQVNAAVLQHLSSGGDISSQFLSRLDPGDSLRVSVIGLDGQVLYDSNSASVNENHSGRKEFTDAIATGHGTTVRRVSSTDDREYFYSATRGDSTVVRSALPYNHTLSQMLSADKANSYFIIVMALLMTVLAWLASHSISRTVKRLRDFANKAEFGDISDIDVHNFPDDELGEISGHIVNLYQIQQQTAAERDRNLREVIHEQQEKNRIKHQLTNNISHELKTPVHVIQGALETLVNHGNELTDDMRQQLIGKSYDNSQRLCALLEDLSVITRISDAPEQIQREPVDLVPLVNHIAEDMAIFPPEQQMRIHINLGETLTISGNRQLLEAIFRNLMTNSFNYSNGRDVWVTLADKTLDEVEITFEDNGVGVAAEHLPRLFERFYRVDVGRSRSMGGTGLGLSIVKNAVLFHGGDINVESRLGGGLKFTFSLKV